jgi:hypothetical protein
MRAQRIRTNGSIEKEARIRTFPMKSDGTFIQIFLDFLNDKTANGLRFEAALRRHPYVIAGERQGFRWNPVGRIDCDGLRLHAASRLRINVANGASKSYQRRIVAELNRLALVTPIVDLATGKPAIGPYGKKIIRRVVALATFEYNDDGIGFGGQPIVNGLEFACWYALLLISRIPGKVRRCLRCDKWCNVASTKRLGFCSGACAKEHDKEMNRRRRHNKRHPDDKLRIVRVTAEKRRKSPRFL